MSVKKSLFPRNFSKLPLLLGLVGKFIYSSMIIVNTLMPKWPVEYVIYTATIPSAFSGAGEGNDFLRKLCYIQFILTDVAIFASAFAYISDVTSVNDRTDRRAHV